MTVETVAPSSLVNLNASKFIEKKVKIVISYSFGFLFQNFHFLKKLLLIGSVGFSYFSFEAAAWGCFQKILPRGSVAKITTFNKFSQ